MRLIQAGDFPAYPDALRFVIATKDAGDGRRRAREVVSGYALTGRRCSRQRRTQAAWPRRTRAAVRTSSMLTPCS